MILQRSEERGVHSKHALLNTRARKLTNDPQRLNNTTLVTWKEALWGMYEEWEYSGLKYPLQLSV